MKLYERAAYNYCLRYGGDPEEKVMYNDGTGHLVARYMPRYKLLAAQFEDMDSRLKCIQEAKEGKL